MNRLAWCVFRRFVINEFHLHRSMRWIFVCMLYNIPAVCAAGWWYGTLPGFVAALTVFLASSTAAVLALTRSLHHEVYSETVVIKSAIEAHPGIAVDQLVWLTKLAPTTVEVITCGLSMTRQVRTEWPDESNPVFFPLARKTAGG